jgi:uncharacterized protein (TIGR00369 family)
MSIPTPPEIARAMEAMAAMAPGLQIPPPVFTDMQAEVQDYRPGDAGTHVGARLTVRMPVLARYRNPMGHVQGGVIAAMVDNAVGPLSYLVAPPSATTQMTVTFLAPLTPDLAHVDVAATLTHRAGRTLVIDAEVSGPGGALLAAARATQTVVRRARAAAPADRA